MLILYYQIFKIVAPSNRFQVLTQFVNADELNAESGKPRLSTILIYNVVKFSGLLSTVFEKFVPKDKFRAIIRNSSIIRINVTETDECSYWLES